MPATMLLRVFLRDQHDLLAEEEHHAPLRDDPLHPRLICLLRRGVEGWVVLDPWPRRGSQLFRSGVKGSTTSRIALEVVEAENS